MVIRIFSARIRVQLIPFIITVENTLYCISVRRNDVEVSNKAGFKK